MVQQKVPQEWDNYTETENHIVNIRVIQEEKIIQHFFLLFWNLIFVKYEIFFKKYEFQVSACHYWGEHIFLVENLVVMKCLCRRGLADGTDFFLKINFVAVLVLSVEN